MSDYIGSAVVVCEETQAVCIELRKRNWEAFSCDVLPCSGGHPEWHIQDDAIKVLRSRQWDLKLGFPPCTDIAVSGAAWFKRKRDDGSQRKSLEFFLAVAELCDMIENPIGIMCGEGKYLKKHFSDLYERAKLIGYPRTAEQIIDPCQFGDPHNKKTCLWLKDLPPLIPTNIVEGSRYVTYASGKRMPEWMAKTGKGSGQVRSKTYPGIAEAMADQWTKFYIDKLAAELI